MYVLFGVATETAAIQCPFRLACCWLSSLTFVHCKCWHFTTHRHRGMILLHLHEWSPQIGMRKPENCRPASSSFPGTARFPRGVFIDTSDRRKFSSGQTRFTQDRWGPLLFLGAIVNDLPSEWVNDEQIYRGIVSNCFWFSALGWPCVWARHHQAIRQTIWRSYPTIPSDTAYMYVDLCVYMYIHSSSSLFCFVWQAFNYFGLIAYSDSLYSRRFIHVVRCCKLGGSVASLTRSQLL